MIALDENDVRFGSDEFSDDVPPPGDSDAPSTTKKRRARGNDAVALANTYVAEHAMHDDGPLLRRWRGDFYRWSTNGCYVAQSDEQIEAELYIKLKLGKRSEVSDVRHALIAVDGVLIDQVEAGGWIDGDGTDPLDTAVCRNGLLHLPTMKLTPATPRYFATSALGIAYDGRAPLPACWQSFLRSLWPTDDEAIQALQEWIGYLLTPDTRQQKIAMLIGPKRSGKGTIQRVTSALLGPSNVAAPTLASLGSNFGLWPLIGKAAAIIGDARLDGRSDIAQIVERLLSISGEDGQTIDRKHRDPWNGRLSTRITVVSNVLPRFTDASDALASRMLMLELAESFYGREDVGLTDRLIEELPGILRWAIAGWQTLRRRGRFVQPESGLESIGELTDIASPVAAWARQRCKTDDSDERFWLTPTDAYGDFTNWCERTGIKNPPTMTTFGRDVKAATGCPKVTVSRAGARPWVYRGLVLR